MTLISYKGCGNNIKISASACQKSGALVKKKWWLPVSLGLVATFLMFGAVVGNSPADKEIAHARRAIDLCWEGQQRKSLAAGHSNLLLALAR